MAAIKKVFAFLLAALVTAVLVYLFIIGGVVMVAVGAFLSGVIIVGAIFLVSWLGIMEWLHGNDP